MFSPPGSPSPPRSRPPHLPNTAAATAATSSAAAAAAATANASDAPGSEWEYRPLRALLGKPDTTALAAAAAAATAAADAAADAAAASAAVAAASAEREKIAMEAESMRKEKFRNELDSIDTRRREQAWGAPAQAAADTAKPLLRAKSPLGTFFAAAATSASLRSSPPPTASDSPTASAAADSRQTPATPELRGGGVNWGRAWQLLITTSQDAIQLNNRGSIMRCMAWRSVGLA